MPALRSPAISVGTGSASEEAAHLREWLFTIALPLWWNVGADRVRGGFHEAIALDGTPAPALHRARSIARMAFSFCEAGRLGWDGPWREAALHALDYLQHHFIAADGTAVSVVDLDGHPRPTRFDLYDQAFALLAFACGHAAFGAATWKDAAVRLLAALRRDHARAPGGYTESGPHALRANPHMHLLEAALAWCAVDDDPRWRHLADEIADLCLTTFIDPASGALRESFSEAGAPVAGVEGRICEPGHHYEWAVLLARWADRTGRDRPEAIGRLIAFADRNGLDIRRGVAVNAVLSDGAVHDPVARLWAQAERIRAYLATDRPDDQIAAAITSLRRFLATPIPGLWFDQLGADDVMILEPARATSLYHIVGAVADLTVIADRERPPRRAGRVVFLVTEDWYFMSHRLPMARAARDAGFEVHVATRVDRHGEAIRSEGFALHPVSWSRGSIDPRDLLRVVREVRHLYRTLAPDLAHHVALSAAVVGSLAATGLPVVQLNAMTGLGTIFTDDNLKIRILRTALATALRHLLGRSRSSVLVQNDDDRAAVLQLGVAPDRITLIPGSGVDVARLQPSPEPSGPVTVAFVGRLVETKGIRTLLAAFERLVARGRDIRLKIAGLPDPANPGSISEQEIASWRDRSNIEYLGFVGQISPLWAAAHIAVLPSHREGLPLSLLEAAACGRPIVATDVPGCRVVARHEVNALLVPRDDSVALADAIDRLAGDPELRRRFGEASRALAVTEFSSDRIGKDLVQLYRQLLQPSA